MSFLNKKPSKGNCYPNYDMEVWLRTCEQEILKPIEGIMTGEIPAWVNGALLRNGAGKLKVGDSSYDHLFDFAALLHRFNIANGKVTYQCRFLKSETYKKNFAANRIVVAELGTSVVPDLCQSMFQRVSTLFKASDEVSDNALVSIYPFNDEYFALTDTPVIHKIDPEALDTLERINLQDKLGIINHTSHPHVMTDGSVYNLGLSIYKTGPAYNIIHFPSGENIFKNARIVAEIPSRWKLHPSYMHTFGITENYFIIVEQPFTLSVPKIFKTQFTKKPMLSCLKWFPESFSNFYLIDRKSGQLKYKFHAEAFFYFHIINQYEKEDHVVIDISCYRDPEILMSCFSVESMRDMQNNPDYAKMFRSRPFRFVLPLRASTKLNLWRRFKASMFKKVSLEESTLENLVKIDNSDAKAFSMSNGSIFCKPEILCNFGCELPQINRVKYLSKEYQYFYAISTDVDAEHPGAIRKVDVVNKTSLTWSEINCYLSEPIFVPSHDQQSEDDGVVLASMIWGRHETNRVGLIVLDAKTMKELGRCEFNDLPGPVPKCLHGWFADANGK